MPPESAPNEQPAQELSFARQSEALQALDLQTESGRLRVDYVLQYAPDAPPADADAVLREQYDQLLKEHEALTKNSEATDLLAGKTMTPARRQLLLTVLESFAAKLAAYEEACIRLQLPGFLIKIGLPSADPDAFLEFTKALKQPLAPVPDATDKRFTDTQRQTLAAERMALEEVRAGDGGTGLADAIENQLMNSWLGVDSGETEQDWKDFRTTLAIFVARKQRYEAEIKLATPPSPMWSVVAGMLTEELAEEGLEALQFGEKPSVLRTANVARLLPGVSPEVRVGLLKADLKMQRMLRLRGVTNIPVLSDVLKTVNKTPFGSKMFSQLLSVESPFTVLFYAYYLHSTDNKIKATMNYAMFMASSAASGACLETVSMLLQSERVLAAVGPRAAAVLSRVAKVPGHPVLKFAAAIAIVFLGQQYIDQFTTWLDDKIPHTPERFRNEMILSMMSGDAIIGDALFGLEEMGLSGLDPEKDRMRYLSTELPTITSEGLDSRFMNDEQSWNDQVRSRVNNPQYNPLRRKFWELETIDSTWYDREAVRLFEDTRLLRQMEADIGSELTKRTYTRNGVTGKETVPVLQSAASLSLSEDVTIDSGYLRTDRILPMMLDNPEHTAGRISLFIKSLPADDPLRASWNEYVRLLQRVAKAVSVYRNLRFASYDREEWLGTGEHVPDKVENGYVEELAYILRRRNVYEAAANDAQISRDTYARSLARMVKPQQDTRSVLGVNVSSAKPVYAVKALSAATEAASQYLPQSLDANILFRDVRHLAERQDPVSAEEILRQRDLIADAIRLHAESGAGEYLPASRDLTSALGLGGTVLSSIDIRDQRLLRDPILDRIPRDKLVGMMLAGAFADRPQNAALTLVQCIIPENGLAVLTLTSVIAAGPDRKNWRVRIRRHHMERGMQPGTQHPFEAEMAAGSSSDVPLEQWLADHPAAAERLEPALAQREAREQLAAEQRKEALDAAMERVQTSKDLFVAIPGQGRFMRSYGEGTVTLQSLPQARTYRNSTESGFGANPVDDYVITVSEPGKPDRDVIINASVVRDFDKQPADIQRIIRSVLTTPIEGEDEASLAAVLNVFPSTYTSVSNIGYAFGYRPTQHGAELQKNLLPLYTEAVQKKYFLEKLLQEMQWRGGTINEATSTYLSEWFTKNQELFVSGTAEDMRRFDAGDRILGYPDTAGLYTFNDGGVVTTFRYSVAAHEWQWSLDGTLWTGVRYRHIQSGPKRYQSPTTAALGLVDKLNAIRA